MVDSLLGFISSLDCIPNVSNVCLLYCQGYAKAAPSLTSVVALGVDKAASKATMNGKAVPNVTYNSTSLSLELSGFQTNLDTAFTLTWE